VRFTYYILIDLFPISLKKTTKIQKYNLQKVTTEFRKPQFPTSTVLLYWYRRSQDPFALCQFDFFFFSSFHTLVV